jgi:hypothetical protein
MSLLNYFGEYEVDAQYKDATKSNVNGEWTTSSPVFTDIKILKPINLTPEQLKFLPENTAIVDAINVLTEFQPTERTLSNDRSKLVYCGKTYEIHSISNVSQDGFYRLVCFVTQ